MTSLAALIRARPGGGVLLTSPGGNLSAGDAATLGFGEAVPQGAAVALAIADPAAFVRTIVALDGVAEALLLLAPGLPAGTVAELMEKAGATILVSDVNEGAVLPDPMPGARPEAGLETRWIMTTSGTTGLPKMVEHRLSGLARSVVANDRTAGHVWGLIYDPSRFAGLQVVLQALIGGGRLVVPAPGMTMADELRFFAEAGVTHLSATPTLWRKMLMLPAGAGLALQQATLGGEIADAAVLRAVAAQWPAAHVTHIYASTELGVGFSVKDGLPGFPASYLADGVKGAALKLVDDMLWAKPLAGERPRGAHLETDADGYIRTGDRMEMAGDRVLFRGRESSLANIGGMKVQPEHLEQAALAHPHVAGALVTVKANPITGSILQLTITPAPGAPEGRELALSVKQQLKQTLPRELQPAIVRVAESLDISASGKLERPK
ncbi:AMP-binding protein [Sandaracinobacteroides hominis]|uniref:AMP-binding protein n=1 Tax=Sandaracinobacteroides hominis TaxID=2780086 RepID=UPI0018F778D1|nr:class I adenylate-forming enzyme family protein [Sandaracinobacteroides hominis]